MSSNPYEAPQTTPPPDPLRAYRWVGNFFLVVSGLIALASVFLFLGFVLFLLAPRPGLNSTTAFLLPAFSNLGIASGLFYAGRHFRRKGRRLPE